MRGTNWQRAGQIIAASVIMLAWPPALLFLGYFTGKLAQELSFACSPISGHHTLWVLIGMLSLGLFALATIRVIAGRSPWRFIDHIRTALILAALLWNGVSGGLLLTLGYTNPNPAIGSKQILLATPGIIPIIQTLGTVTALRFTEKWTAKKRILLLSALTLGIPTLWISAVEVLALIIC